MEQPGSKSIKHWDHFKKWLVNNEYQTLHDFKEIIVRKFKTSRCDQMCMYEVEDGTYEYCGKKKILRSTQKQKSQKRHYNGRTP